MKGRHPISIGPAALGPSRYRIDRGSATWYLLRNRLAVISLVVIAALILVAVFAPFLTPYAQQGEGKPNPISTLLPPSASHPFGTDELGRDVLARVLFGARSSLILGFSVVAFGSVFGTALGSIAGYFGGWLDELIMRFTDIVLSFPSLLLAIALAATLEPNLLTAIVAISVTWWPWYTRIARGQAVSIRERHYVLAARAMGAPGFWTLRHHIVPNVLGPVRVQAALDLGAAVLTGASLSFLGLGPQPPSADWGVMISTGRQYLLGGHWWLSIFPGLAIYLTVLAFNFFGDGIGAALNPRSRQANDG